MPDSDEKYLPWLVLREIPLLGTIIFHRLLAAFQNPEKILSTPEKQLKKIPRISQATVSALRSHGPMMAEAKEELRQIRKRGAKIVTIQDHDYPPLLKEIPDPPPFLTYFGNIDTEAPGISVIGSRAATSYGMHTARNLSAQLAASGFQVVSGMAKGIDTQAHRGALDEGGKTTAVLGSGLNVIYPWENRQLFRQIQDTGGTIFSEYKMNEKPLAAHFPHRNRIIAGLSCGSVVVEATKKSGSLITAGLAAEYNREVFAVPGSIASLKSQGTHALLKQGAKLVETQMDILDELGHFIHKKNENSGTGPLQKKKTTQLTKETSDRQALMRCIEVYPVHIDQLIEKSGLAAPKVSSLLFDLEMQNMIVRHQGNYYSITEDYH